MKTKITLFLIACAFTLNSNAQLLNGGFENWTNNGSYSDPDNWYSLNYLQNGNRYRSNVRNDHKWNL